MSRAEDLERVGTALLAARRVVLTTHVNADGDGTGSEVAVARWLARRGAEPTIVNPTPFPGAYRFLLRDFPDLPVHTPREREGRAALDRADLFLVLDTSEPERLGALPEAIGDRPVAALDHHPTHPTAIGDPAARHPEACATGELVYDLLRGAGENLDLVQARALYVAIVTDTGSFRFSNATPRAHEICARLLEVGVRPEAMYRHLFARWTATRLAVLERALARLRTDPGLPIAWITLPRETLDELGAGSEDVDGVVEYPRRLEGVEVAVFFRELPDGRVKASLRSNGEADVAAVATRLGGGGHVKAAGVLLDRPLPDAEAAVLEEVRREVRRIAS